MIYFLCRNCYKTISTAPADQLIFNSGKIMLCAACGDTDENLQASSYQEVELARHRRSIGEDLESSGNVKYVRRSARWVPPIEIETPEFKYNVRSDVLMRFLEITKLLDELKDKGLRLVYRNEDHSSGERYVKWEFKDATGRTYRCEGNDEVETLGRVMATIKQLPVPAL